MMSIFCYMSYQCVRNFTYNFKSIKKVFSVFFVFYAVQVLNHSLKKHLLHTY